MTYWNHRVIKREIRGEVSFGIHEVYYGEDNVPHSYTTEPVEPYGDTLEELEKDLERFKLALKKPVLTKEDFPFGDI